MNLFGNLLREILYNPCRHIKSLPFVSVGRDTIILPSARFTFRLGAKNFQGKITIGDNSMIGGEFIFESNNGEVSVGDGTFINSGTRIICRENIKIGSNVTIAWNCILYDHNSHSLSWTERKVDLRQQIADFNAGKNFIHGKNWATVKSRPIVIGDKAWLGFGVTVLNGVHIGEGAIIGASSVVRADAPAWTIAYGNPATPQKAINK
ncbi:acyltransferase [Methylomonas rapida]|uniref:Acyltransferase n=1 Tax=Methylomonas rapida TaxID=2963939 RepID=A0ABY7GJ85_9GAMM|nr:acyltransferase [Methylomonas rapida]WAR44088.1 acyltransferase [Methylomonas rapida]